MAEQAGRFGQAELTRAAGIISEGLIQMRGTTSPRLLLELMCAQVLLPLPAPVRRRCWRGWNGWSISWLPGGNPGPVRPRAAPRWPAGRPGSGQGGPTADRRGPAVDQDGPVKGSGPDRLWTKTDRQGSGPDRQWTGADRLWTGATGSRPRGTGQDQGEDQNDRTLAGMARASGGEPSPSRRGRPA